MRRLVIVASLAEGAEERAAELIEAGPPFDPGDTRFDRHSVHLTEHEAIFVFEGLDVEWEVDDLTSDFLRPEVRTAIEDWEPLLAGRPRIAREVYSWDRADQLR